MLSGYPTDLLLLDVILADLLLTPRHMMLRFWWSVHMGKKAGVFLTLDGDLCHTVVV
jgi:hypothetical protein